MVTTILTCPQCGAPLTASRFAATAVCRYCKANVRIDPSSVSTARYREAFEKWNSASSNDGMRLSIGNSHWTAVRLLAHGELSDVYLSKRARWPSDLAIFKIVRDDDDAPLLQHEVSVLETLRSHAAVGAIDLGARIPDPLTSGRTPNGQMAAAYRFVGGFTHTFEMVRDRHPEGIEPVAAIWVWRRLLEIVGVLHRSGVVHGAIVPNHLLIERGEHGVRLVGFSCADKPGAPLRLVSTNFETLYPKSLLDSEQLSADADTIMTARCVSYLLAARDVPGPLADLLARVGAERPDVSLDPSWLHERLGEIGRSVFGPPSFHPIDLN